VSSPSHGLASEQPPEVEELEDAGAEEAGAGAAEVGAGAAAACWVVVGGTTAATTGVSTTGGATDVLGVGATYTDVVG